MEIPLSFGETWTLFGVWTAAKLTLYLKWRFAVWPGIIDVLRGMLKGLDWTLDAVLIH